MKILVVDDEIMLIGLLELMLSDYEVIGATNGREAVEKYKEWRPDMVLMDIMMPLMDGIEATREILKMDRNAKVLAVTAYANGKSKEIMEAGALEIIEKPFTRELLGNTIKKYLKRAPNKLKMMQGQVFT